MFERILVPVDGSRASEQAIPVAESVARRAGGSVELVWVAERGAAAEGEGEDERAMRRYLELLVEDVTESLRAPACCRVLSAPVAAQGLTRHAREAGADLIVMTSHGRGGIERAWLGATMERTLRRSRIPVLVVRPVKDGPVARPGGYETILLPLDGSERAEAVLPQATALARLFGARLVLLRVVRAPVLPASIYLPDLARANRASIERERAEAERYTRGVEERLRAEGLAVTAQVEVAQSIAPAILRFIEEAGVDLVVMATHGRGGLLRHLTGRVADKIMRSADVPLLLVRSRRAAPQLTPSAVASYSRSLR